MNDHPAGLTRPTLEYHTPLSRCVAMLVALALLTMLSLPWWADAGTIRSVIELSCYLVLAQMWNLMAGYAGLVSIGQQAFIGLAGYALFVLSNHLGIHPFLASALCLVVPALVALPCYLLLRRLEGPYFAIGTWVVAEVCRLLASGTAGLGSSSGMTLRAMQQVPPALRELGVLWLAAAMLVLALGGSYALLRSRHGLALMAMRDNPVSAASQGVNVGRLRFLVFLLTSVGCGMVGAVYYLNALRLSPNAGFDPGWTSIAIFMVMVGGIGSLEGPLLGALIYFLADRWFSAHGATYMIVLGLLTLLVAVFARHGLWGAISARADWRLFPVQRRVRFERGSPAVPEK
ncbi:MAG: branched-chain amino acid ABC transporter permease [Burkholderiales bacterium]|nr:MAG: branched-chain amino acid ABC transporter permease [Burkholderiales bacterium]